MNAAIQHTTTLQTTRRQRVSAGCSLIVGRWEQTIRPSCLATCTLLLPRHWISFTRVTNPHVTRLVTEVYATLQQASAGLKTRKTSSIITTTNTAVIRLVVLRLRRCCLCRIDHTGATWPQFCGIATKTGLFLYHWTAHALAYCMTSLLTLMLRM